MKPENTLTFALEDVIQGAGIGPSRIPMSLLGQFQQDVKDFLRGSDKDSNVNEAMVAIESSSFDLVVSGQDHNVGLWADIERLQQEGSLGRIDPKRAAVVEGWQYAARKHPRRHYRLLNADKHIHMEVNANTHFHDAGGDVWVAVEKYLIGRVVDLGGKTKPNVHLALDDGTMLRVGASENQLATDDRNRLYRREMLHVVADENLQTGELRKLVLKEFDEYQPAWDEAAFGRLVEKGTQAWAEVPDGSGWLERIRGENR